MIKQDSKTREYSFNNFYLLLTSSMAIMMPRATNPKRPSTSPMARATFWLYSEAQYSHDK